MDKRLFTLPRFHATAFLTVSRVRRIIKDVMNQQLREGEERKKGRKRTMETSSPSVDRKPDVVLDDDIEPADFFDPEEFVNRGGGFRASRA